jgi:Ca-activated chloride channel family protein
VPPLTAAEAAQSLGVKVYTIGVGIRGNAPMPVGRDAFGRKVYRQVAVDIDEDTLTRIADRTGGKYFRADSTKTLRSIYEERSTDSRRPRSRPTRMSCTPSGWSGASRRGRPCCSWS